MTYNTRSIESRSERFLVFCLYVGGLNGLRQVYHGMHNNKTKDYGDSGFCSCPTEIEWTSLPSFFFIVDWLFAVNIVVATITQEEALLLLLLINYITYNILLVCRSFARATSLITTFETIYLRAQAVHGNRPEAQIQSAFKYAALIISQQVEIGCFKRNFVLLSNHGATKHNEYWVRKSLPTAFRRTGVSDEGWAAKAGKGGKRASKKFASMGQNDLNDEAATNTAN